MDDLRRAEKSFSNEGSDRAVICDMLSVMVAGLRRVVGELEKKPEKVETRQSLLVLY